MLRYHTLANPMVIHTPNNMWCTTIIFSVLPNLKKVVTYINTPKNSIYLQDHIDKI